jgi:uncharacterized protein
MFWFDLDNSPHVPLFKPIFKEFDKRNLDYLVTIREYAQTRQLCELWGIKYKLIDKHAGKNKFLKIINLINRSSKLKEFVKDKKISLAISHGSRTQLVTCHRLKIRSILMLDYEYTENMIFNYLSNYILVPVHIPEERLKSAGINVKKVVRYNGFKEEIYLSEFKPDKEFRKKIGISDKTVLIVIRPPGLLSNYHNTNGEHLFLEAIKYFSGFSNCCCYIVSRTDEDKILLKNSKIKTDNIKFNENAVDGLQLLNVADIVLSGGGTMNRESALLGTETYSIFKGMKPYLDGYLQNLGMLKFINSEKDFKKIVVERKNKSKHYNVNSNLITEISNLFLNINNN